MKLTKNVIRDAATEESHEIVFLHDDEGGVHDVADLLGGAGGGGLSWSLIAKLVEAGVHNRETLDSMSDEEILALPGVGKAALREIRGE